ncbi:hypothetical protein Pmani_009988 [Petrolisthes manimaculis]|uniref:Uncharacterized protein n=1 Tax=Petrolisthes manimaculis TaxID=1843537 RepID=A0AAE1Q3N6_9EUCA|nr:hypothetical protein Pmani_009988 [Petrolisthes manimaculis]
MIDDGEEKKKIREEQCRKNESMVVTSDIYWRRRGTLVERGDVGEDSHVLRINPCDLWSEWLESYIIRDQIGD